MKIFSLKKLFLFSILLTAMNLVACGNDSSSADDENECRKDPLSCSTGPQEGDELPVE